MACSRASIASNDCIYETTRSPKSRATRSDCFQLWSRFISKKIKSQNSSETGSRVSQNRYDFNANESVLDAASDTLASISLDDNRIDCTCDLKKFGYHLKSPTSEIFKLIKPDELTCSYPMSLNGKLLSSVWILKITFWFIRSLEVNMKIFEVNFGSLTHTWGCFGSLEVQIWPQMTFRDLF